MNTRHHDIRLLRGYKIRLLRVPSRLPWKTGGNPLEGSPRFVPFLFQGRSVIAPFELRAYPGPPLGREPEISYLDAALLATASLFSLLLSQAGRLLLQAYKSLFFSKEHANISTRTQETLTEILAAGSNVWGWPDHLDEGAWGELAEHQDELTNAFARYRQRKNAEVKSRKRELVSAFRAENLKISPPVTNVGELRTMVRNYINNILADKTCAGYRPIKRGYARTHGGLMNKALRPGGPSVLLFSPCKTPQGISLFYSDLEIRLLRYKKLSELAPPDRSTGNGCANLLAKAEILLSIAGRGDFIQMPLLWWGEGGKGAPAYWVFIRHLLAHSEALRFVFLALGSLFLQNTKELLQASPQCPTFGHARLLLEAGLAHLYHVASSEQHRNGDSYSSPSHASTKIIRLALENMRDNAPKSTKEFFSFVSRYRWGGEWGLPETIIFASRAPLPLRILTPHSTRKSTLGSALVEEIRSLQRTLPNQ